MKLKNINKTHLQILLILLGFIIILILQDNFFRFKNTEEKVDENSETKQIPYDNFFFQRSFPDTIFNHRAFAAALSEAKKDLKLKNNSSINLEWDIEGPGNIGGRINVIEINPDSSNVIYAGSASGGIFKTTNGGNDWFPIFDDQPYLAIGAIAIDPSNTSIIYAGTGDPNITGYPFMGDGVYKSTDAGNTWIHMGLAEASIVSKIIIDSTNTNIIYAATMGLPFVRTNDRGLYKSIDGGSTWAQILFIDDDAGVIDLAINPLNTQVLYAAGWNRIRNNTESLIYGYGAKIYKTTDGGTNWTILTYGLPQSIKSRIGLRMSAQDTSVLYTLYVGTNLNLDHIYKTQDAGASWSQLPATNLPSNFLGGFGWYFGKIRVNPFNDNEVYALGVNLYHSTDGGNTWAIMGSSAVHADKHDLAFIDSLTFLLATDGGMYKTSDGGQSWTDCENIPNTQFYRVATDPFNSGFFAGGTQDNGTLYGGQSNYMSWQSLYGGDGFQAIFDYNNSSNFYAEMQNGSLGYSNGSTFQYFGYGISTSDRRSWDMPFTMSQVNSDVLYCGTYRIYKITNAPINNTWQAISDDLTNGVNSTNHVITTIDESPLDTNYVYAGTSDGYVWRTLDGGILWENITNNLPNRYVTSVESSPNFTNTVFVSHSGYKDYDFLPRIHKSTDNGNSWTNISGNLPDLAINDVFILSGFSDLIVFVATDGGVYYTADGGLFWERLGNNMPILAVYDIDYQASSNTLIAGTFGRAIMSISIDSLLPLVNIPETVLAKSYKLKIFPSIANENLNISFDDKLLIDAEIQIIDNMGRVCQVSKVDKTSTKINISNLKNGIYNVCIYGKNGKLFGRFVKY
ncbi:MAG: T9SS type A sorting domain-containing protein [Bacteroidetes bacterium]|jgi:photosystem II stability/assembly factor-like uncharacterized protein|nr:T9SS type A sorting domain-containing protein [Bacteroidota bacterium]MBT6688066.1 T9SS type A sorting domain-containing protein [Bacteroidota bacterium]MBT7145018.1 T9SS type A sorting domain-containing protein [Bacteroidota bacterium]MBT7492068.1 T9SS type A sorting domain-containing protein [Bacteroidota bacterium]